MPVDLAILGDKLLRYRKQFQATLPEVSNSTGIPEQILEAYETGIREPTGGHILILADYYHCDYNFFISNEKLAPFEQTENLFRKHGDELSKEDRWAIQEFLFLCECEEYLLGKLSAGIQQSSFQFKKIGTYYKGHGEQSAAALRRYFGYADNEVRMDVFADFRSLRIHVFRRALNNSKISGLFIRHPTAGRCILVNYSEDLYRQRFTASHEAGHAILDDGSDPVISFTKWDPSDLSEVRAHTFASHYLMPRDFLRAIPESKVWTTDKAKEWAAKLKVSTSALARALLDSGLVDKSTADHLKTVKVPLAEKDDVELPSTLSPASRGRKEELLKRGLSGFYVNLCFDAYEKGTVSAGRLAEMLLVSSLKLPALAELYGKVLSYGD